MVQSEFRDANRRAKNIHKTCPRAVSARYDRRSGLITVRLNSNLILSFSPRDVQGLEQGRPSQLEQIEITPSGLGLHFPELDSDLYIPGLLEGSLGSMGWMASRLGRAGGRSTSTAKKAASRANGRLGGRPRKASSR